MVLLVDDDPDLLEVLALVLDRAHVRHLAAHSFAEVEALEPVLDGLTTAILDVNLGAGEPTGVDIADWLHARHPKTRIVFMTGHAPNHPLVLAASGGEVLAKPIDTKRLIRIAQS